MSRRRLRKPVVRGKHLTWNGVLYSTRRKSRGGFVVGGQKRRDLLVALQWEWVNGLPRTVEGRLIEFDNEEEVKRIGC